MTPPTTPKPKSKRGFASMSPELRRIIAAKGGAATPPHKRAFSLNPALAVEAGRKGGQMSHGGGRKAAK